MSIFQYLDQLFFGPALRFAAKSRYSLEDSVERLRSAILPRFAGIARPFKTGLCGVVEPSRVHVKVHYAWRRSGVAWFDGAFLADSSGVTLDGEIHVPLAYKLLLLVPIPVIIVDLVMADQRGAHLPSWTVIIATAIFVQAIILVASRLQRRCDDQAIADALDNALT
jgi:hypothetical protein